MILLVAGARPNFMKIAPIIWELRKTNLKYKFIHTGQHYHKNMSECFLEDFDIKPHYFLNVGSGSHGLQTARVMERFEKVCMIEKPTMVVVVGDVNSTLACAITAKKLGIKVAHVESGLRSFDMRMPEEINRKLADHISNILFVSLPSGVKNLEREGITKGVYMVGNVMIDALLAMIGRRRPPKKTMKHIVATFHRPENVDSKVKLSRIILELKQLNENYRVILACHPRTRKNIQEFGIDTGMIVIVNPMRYKDFIGLVSDALCVITDSGGIQEEAAFLGVRCITVRENTERPEVSMELIDTYDICKTFYSKPISHSEKVKIKGWDGKAAIRIVKVLEKYEK